MNARSWRDTVMQILRTLLAWLRRRWLPAEAARSPGPPPWRQRLPGGGEAARQPGLVLPTAMFTALLIVVGVLLVAARNLSSLFRASSSTDARAAREAAEYGFSEILGQLNTDDNAYLLVTNYSNWQTISSADLNNCQVNFTSTNPPAANRIAGVASNSANSSQTLPNNINASYSLTNYAVPALPPGQSNVVNGGCTSSTNATKFGNLKGGSATLTVVGTVTRSGQAIASYTLQRVVHVKWPSDSLANPMLFLGLGSQMKLLDGNICNTTDTTVTSCNGLPRTTLGCINLDDCLYNNVDIVSPKVRDAYCADKTRKKYRKGVICNDFQQASDILPNFPVPSSFGDSRATTSQGWLYPPDITCADTKLSNCTVQAYDSSGNKVPKTTTENFQYMPYNVNAKNLPTGPSTLPATLNSGCQYNAAKASNATQIVCIFKDFQLLDKTTPANAVTAYSTVSKKKVVSTTPALPVNIFVKGVFNLNAAGMQNNSVTNWQNLRIFGLNSGATLADGSPDCTKQSVMASTSKGIGIDGAFLWFPNASITYKSAGKSAAYLVMWVCQFTGPTAGKSGDYWIVNPIPRRGINAGLKAGLAGYGANINATTYRGYGVSAEF